MLLFTFDLDGVLHINPFNRKVFPEVCRRLAPAFRRRHGAEALHAGGEGTTVHNHEIPREDHFGDETERAVMRLIVAEAKRRLNEGRLVEAYDWDDIVRTVAIELGYEETIDVRGLVEAACVPPYIDLHPYAGEALEGLKRRGVRLFTLSNGYDVYQYPVLRALGLAGYFERRIAPEVVGIVKPMRGIFHRALEEAGLEVDRRWSGGGPANARPKAGRESDEDGVVCVVHVGDSLIHDVFGAKGAGLVTVWVHRPLSEALPGVPPWERPVHPSFPDVLRSAFARELNVPWYGIQGWEEAYPDYAVATLRELDAVYEHLVGGRR